jgi:hypothetical protein
MVASDFYVVVEQFTEGHREWYWGCRPIDNGWLGSIVRSLQIGCHLGSRESVVLAIVASMYSDVAAG